MALSSLLIGVRPAGAAFGLAVVPTLPSPVTVGQAGVPGALTISNTSTPPESTTPMDISNITLVPSCGVDLPGPDCPAGSREPGVFQINPPASGRVGTACAGATFNVVVVDAAQGKVQFVPGAAVVLLGGASCAIDFTFDVLKSPTIDAAAGPGLQTAALSSAFGSTPIVTAGGVGTALVTVATPTATLSTQVTPVSGTAIIGDPVFDTATVTGVVNGPVPTGSITFLRFVEPPAAAPCSGASSAETAALGPGPPPTPGAPPTAIASSTLAPAGAAGTIRFVASYSGDANYAAVTSACGAPNENVTVAAPPKAVPSMFTGATPAGTPAITGQPVFDTATVVGLGFVVPTGTVTFTRFVDPFGAAPCSGPSTTEVVALVAGPPPSSLEPPTATATSTVVAAGGPGTVRFVASYSGDANYDLLPTSPCNAPNESVTVQGEPVITTQVTPAQVSVGQTFTDTVTVTGVAGGPVPTGLATFTVFTDPIGGSPCSGASQVLPAVVLAPVGGSSPPASSATSPAVAATTTAVYRFVAAYAGDAAYAADTSVCDAPNESVSVLLPAGLATQVTPVSGTAIIGDPVFDTATVTGVAGVPAPTGTVTFTRFADPPGAPPCSGPSTTQAPVPLAPGPVSSPPTAIASSPAVAAGGPGTIRFVAAYSGDANYAAVPTTPCGAANENVTVGAPPVSLAVTPNLLTPVPAGRTGAPGSVTVQNTSDPAAGTVTLTSITLVPSCGSLPGAAGDCPAGAVDPGVLQVGSTGIGATGTACAGTSFTVTVVDPASGRVGFVPASPVVLAAGGGPVAATSCRIDFAFSANRLPAKDASPSPGADTVAVAAAAGSGQFGTSGSGFGATFVAVAPATPSLTTSAGPTPVPFGTQLRDTATLAAGLNPTGGLTFTLFGPDDASCSGSPAFTSTVPVSGNGAYPSGGFMPTAPGTYRWVAVYSGDVNNVAVGPTACADPLEAVVVRALPTISVAVTPVPASRPEPGGTFLFDVVVTNTGGGPVTLTALTDDVYGNLVLRPTSTCTTAPGTSLAPGASYRCQFTGDVAGRAGLRQVNTVAASAVDALGTSGTAAGAAAVTLTAAIPTITVAVSAAPAAQPEPGGTVTFTVLVTDTGVNPVTISSLTDDVHGDLNGRGTCAIGATITGGGGSYRCAFAAGFSGNAGARQTVTVTVTALDGLGQSATASGPASLVLTDVAPTITVQKQAQPPSRPEPGGTFTYTVIVTNRSFEAVRLISLTDDRDGNLNGKGTCVVGAFLAPGGGTSTCTYQADFTGNARAALTSTTNAVVLDDDGTTASASGNVSVALTDVPPTLSVTVVPAPASLPQPGGTFTYSVSVTNISFEPVQLTSIVDNAFAAGLGGLGTCVPGGTIVPGGTFSCSFLGDFLASGGSTLTNPLAAAVVDDDGTSASASASATVAVTAAPVPNTTVTPTTAPPTTVPPTTVPPTTVPPTTAPPTTTPPASAPPVTPPPLPPPPPPPVITLDTPSGPPGGQVTAEGTGCPAGAPVTLQVAGAPVGSATAAGDGSFRASFELPVLDPGGVDVVATCGPVTLTTRVEIVLASSLDEGTATLGILLFFVLIALALTRRGGPGPRGGTRHGRSP